MKSSFRVMLVSLLLSIAMSGVGYAQDSTPESEVHSQTSISSDVLDTLPTSEAGTVSVVSAGDIPTSGVTIPLLIHNNTNEPVFDLSVKIEIWDADGTLIGVEKDSYGITPDALYPGDYGLSSFQTDFDTLPADAEFTYKVEFETTEPGFKYKQNLEFGELSLTENKIIGTISNPNDVAIGDVWLQSTCIGDDGKLFNFSQSSPDSNGTDRVVEPGDSSTFQMEFWSTEPCDHYLITGYGSES